jgi:hypothetical protein
MDVLVKALEIFAVGAHVHEEDSGLEIRAGVLLGDDRLLNGIHAADAGTIGMGAGLGVPGTDALQPGNLLGLGFVGRPDEMAPERPGGGEYPLKLQAGDHAGQVAVTIEVIGLFRVKGLKARGQHHRPHLQSQLPALVF